MVKISQSRNCIKTGVGIVLKGRYLKPRFILQRGVLNRCTYGCGVGVKERGREGCRFRAADWITLGMH